MGNMSEKKKKYEVNFTLSFTRAEVKKASQHSKMVSVEDDLTKEECAIALANVIQSYFAGINEFPVEEVEVNVTSFSEIN